jgi:hypothetical protein
MRLANGMILAARPGSVLRLGDRASQLPARRLEARHSPLYLTSNPKDGKGRQPTPGAVDHRQQALASEGLSAGLGPRNGFPAGQQAGRATKTVPRASLALCEPPGWARGGTSKAAHTPVPRGALVRRVSHRHKPDKPDKLFSSAYNGENGLFSHARGERFVRLVRLQQLFMGRPAKTADQTQTTQRMKLLVRRLVRRLPGH